MSLERISGGQSNPTYFVTYANRRMVLCKQPGGSVLPSAHAVDREYRIMNALANTDVPVPRMILYCDDRSVIGTRFYLMERLEDRVFADCSLPAVARLLEGEKMAGLCREFDISRKTGYKLFERYKNCGIDGLNDRSRRPHRHANQLPFRSRR